jgi:hypothetical protein
MMKTAIAIFCLFLLCSCASQYSGDSLQAKKARYDVAVRTMDGFAPDGCSYIAYKGIYACKDGEPKCGINDRALRVKKEIEDYYKYNPYAMDEDRLGEILLDLYHCRKRDGSRMDNQTNPMYCKTAIPKLVLNLYEREGFIVTVDSYNDLHKYTIMPK